VPRVLEITFPPERTSELIEIIEANERAIGYRIQRSGSTLPPGDVITLTITNRGLHPFMRSLQTRGLLGGEGWSISVQEPAGLIIPQQQERVEEDTNEVTWEEMNFTILRESNMTINALLVMATSGIFAAVGIATGAVHLVIAGMVIAPGFAPITRIGLDLVSGSGEWLHGIIDTLKAYGALVSGALLASFVLLITGTPLLDDGDGYLSTASLVSFWTQLTAPGLLITMTAGGAGAILIASNRSVLTAGVMIALALVPPPAIAALALLDGATFVAGRALIRWVIEAGIVGAMGVLVFVWKQEQVHQRRALH
jgi:hypothetical protein